MNTPKIAYCNSEFDRNYLLRKDSNWINEQHQQAKSNVLVVWRNRPLTQSMNQATPPKLQYCSYEFVQSVIGDARQMTFLGTLEGKSYFTVDVSHLDADKSNPFTQIAQFVDLRVSGPVLPAVEASFAAYAKGMLYWQRNHRFCGKCGHQQFTFQAGHVMQCSNKVCAKESFPRTDPAVIMLVENRSRRGERQCLLGRQASWPKGCYSTLAGFVEPGESLEQAVKREVKEETGVDVNNIHYTGSQPWPFPGSIMLGFSATATSSCIDLGDDELEDARWFSEQEVRSAGHWQDEAAALRLSRTDSISHYLIQSWAS